MRNMADALLRIWELVRGVRKADRYRRVCTRCLCTGQAHCSLQSVRRCIRFRMRAQQPFPFRDNCCGQQLLLKGHGQASPLRDEAFFPGRALPPLQTRGGPGGMTIHIGPNKADRILRGDPGLRSRRAARVSRFGRTPGIPEDSDTRAPELPRGGSCFRGSAFTIGGGGARGAGSAHSPGKASPSRIPGSWRVPIVTQEGPEVKSSSREGARRDVEIPGKCGGPLQS